MAGDDIKYTVGVDFTGEGELKRAASAVSNLERATAQGTGVASGAKHAWANFGVAISGVGAAVFAVSKAAGAAYDLLRQGAALQTTQERFEKLSASINTTADSLLGRMRTATQGMIADSELMASASGIMSLKLADNADQVVRLATVVGTLGWDMQQVILTFANLSTMRLDALGLSVDEVKTKQKELMEQGLEMSEAFKEAVIQAGEARLDVGGVSESEQAFKQATAAVTNFKDNLAQAAISALDAAGGVDALTNAATRLSLIQQISEISHQLQEAGLESDNFFAKLISAGDLSQMTTTELYQKLAQLQTQIAGLTPEIENGTEGWRHYGVITQTALQGIEYELDALQYLAGGVTSVVTGAAAEMSAALAMAMADWAGVNVGNIVKAPGQGKTNLYARWVSDTNERNRAADETRASLLEEAQAMNIYRGALSAVTEEEQRAAEARQRFVAAFNQELLGKPEEGLINAEGVINVEAMNEALYRQVEAAGASAATLALLGIATGQFSEEQAEAALKAAILQEQINQIADAVVAGKITLEQAIGQLGDAQANLNQADLITVAQGVTAIPEGERTVAVEADVSEANKAIGGVQTTLSLMTDAPYLTTLDADIAGLLTGTDDAKRAIDSVPSQLTVTINWAQAGVDVLGALRALGIVL